MIPRAFVVIGIGVLAMGFSPIVQAQSSRQPGANNGGVTLSGDSLHVESRSINDFNTFFNSNPQAAQTNSVTPVGRLTETPKKSPINDILKNDNVDVIFGDTPARKDAVGSTSYSTNGDTGNGDTVRVQYQVGR